VSVRVRPSEIVFINRSVSCRTSYLEHVKSCPQHTNIKLYCFCWERHYFASEQEQREARSNKLALEFYHNHADRAQIKLQPQRFTPHAPASKPLHSPPKPDERALAAAPRTYSLVFLDVKSAREGHSRLYGERRVPFEFGPRLQVTK